ncbi:hypothetical protein [Microbacterium esteraromaticum]|uniref:hypothetical protein n=1 Tax=Microbacterium esteraromaticum TaxID=57043 RepID=UPI00195702D7|nr:hypothetical protein [Microbacterium esteraromaticum]MBM7466907.1 hypothetical protein [Microbacterium esteraromaticum]
MVAMWIVTLSLPDPRPASVGAAASKIESYFDRIEGSLPADAILERSEDIAEKPCPLDDLGDRASVRRSLHIDGDLDRVAWVASLDEVFPETDGWTMRIRALDSRENLSVRLVADDLAIIDITASAASGEARITLQSTSECDRPS